MRKRNTQIKYSHNQGSALITVLVVITVLMVIVLSVLAISYQYYMSEATDIYKQKCQDTVQSLSKELRSEIENTHFDSYEDQKDTENEVWSYLRTNIAQKSWPYYDAAEAARPAYTGSNDAFSYDVSEWKKAGSLADAKRYFDLLPEDTTNSVLSDELPVTTVCMYWEPGTYLDRVADIKLHIIITCKMGDYSYTIREGYQLKTGTYTGTMTDPLEKENYDAETWIYKYQKWEWEYVGEE